MNTCIEIDLETVECCTCGIVFGLPRTYLQHIKDNGKTFYCPNGDPQWFGQSTADKLKKQLEQANGKLATAQIEILAAEKKIKRLETRIKNGVCPCCHRQFVNVQRHIHNKHPEFSEG